MRAVAPFRLLRSSVLAASTLSLAAGAHTAAGGRLPDPLLFAAMASFTLLLCMLVSRWRLGTTAVLSLLIGSQFALHQGFEWFSASPMPFPLSGMQHHGMQLMQQPIAGEATHNMVSSGMNDGLGMLSAHAVATVLTALLVARGEAALCALADWLRPLLSPPSPALLPILTGKLIAPQRTVRAEPQQFLTALRLRGPPSFGLSTHS
ncbi:hypothetical protein [Psychromicrobium sp. YIM B11713]|uniref:hypothetical protein n=1 Tax=Psychromicrobium sp. YIM B11713 TaxID=3145233 RepID=UPI00374E8DF4